MKNLFKWLYYLGLLLAIVGAFVPSLGAAAWWALILILIGILVGIFYFDSEDVVNIGLRYLILAATASALTNFIVIGPYLTAIFTAIVGFLAPAVLTTLVVWFVKKSFMGKK
jgi:hypothetical protein